MSELAQPISQDSEAVKTARIHFELILDQWLQ
jgi:hypothetical protein